MVPESTEERETEGICGDRTAKEPGREALAVNRAKALCRSKLLRYTDPVGSLPKAATRLSLTVTGREIPDCPVSWKGGTQS